MAEIITDPEAYRLNYSEALFNTFLMECSDWAFIFSPDIEEILDRYALHKQGIYSFGQCYDDLPNWWVDAINLLNTEQAKATKAWQRINK